MRCAPLRRAEVKIALKKKRACFNVSDREFEDKHSFREDRAERGFVGMEQLGGVGGVGGVGEQLGGVGGVGGLCPPNCPPTPLQPVPCRQGNANKGATVMLPALQ